MKPTPSSNMSICLKHHSWPHITSLQAWSTATVCLRDACVWQVPHQKQQYHPNTLPIFKIEPQMIVMYSYSFQKGRFHVKLQGCNWIHSVGHLLNNQTAKTTLKATHLYRMTSLNNWHPTQDEAWLPGKGFDLQMAAAICTSVVSSTFKYSKHFKRKVLPRLVWHSISNIGATAVFSYLKTSHSRFPIRLSHQCRRVHGKPKLWQRPQHAQPSRIEVVWGYLMISVMHSHVFQGLSHVGLRKAKEGLHVFLRLIEALPMRVRIMTLISYRYDDSWPWRQGWVGAGV